MAPRRLEELTSEDCLALLDRSQIGRLVYQDDRGPLAVPVNFAMDGSDVVVRVHSVAQGASIERQVAFEVDHIDEDEHSGWSVLVRGVGHEVDPDLVPELVRRMGEHFPAPWAAGVHNVWLRITPHEIIGRRLGEPATALWI
jgi:nitroimidazol reductase NimA-like FMN-containing flavoprotein (pyridoxamine 5'-phosphate oxidase superfamily)